MTPASATRPETVLQEQELRRRLVQLMVFRVVLITFVMGATIVINLTSPDELARPGSTWLFGVIGVTYLLTLVYALALRSRMPTRRMALLQITGDLVVTSWLVHLTGGAQSGYAFFYLLSILGAALVHYRLGAAVAALAAALLFAAVSLLGWYRLLPVPLGQRVVPWEIPMSALLRQLALNGAAFAAVAFLATKLGQQLASTGARLESQAQRSADLAAQSADVIRCLSSGLITVDDTGRVLTFNEAAAEILGVPTDHGRGRDIIQVMPELAELLMRLDAGQGVRREVVRFKRGGEERVLGVSVSPLTDRERRPIGRIANFQDLTELRRMETQVKRAEHLAAVGQMAAGVAHEIRNPLASISGSIELLRKAPQLDPDSGALMDIVLREVDRLNRLITDLLEYARPRERVPTRFELAQLCEETVRVFSQDRSTAGLTVAFEPAEDARELMVSADAAQLRQVLWNLLRNAAEAMPSGGAARVTLRRVVAEAAAEEEQLVELAVADQGVGIAREDQERIFEPFFTTKARGSGLGLATTQRIVADHGGAITVDSTPGRGTRIAVRLPVAKRPPSADGEERAYTAAVEADR